VLRLPFLERRKKKVLIRKKKEKKPTTPPLGRCSKSAIAERKRVLSLIKERGQPLVTFSKVMRQTENRNSRSRKGTAIALGQKGDKIGRGKKRRRRKRYDVRWAY